MNSTFHTGGKSQPFNLLGKAAQTIEHQGSGTMLQTKENFQKARASGYLRHQSVTETTYRDLTDSVERI